MPKLRISGALQYLVWFLGKNERNKCGGMPKWLYIVGNLKNKVDCSKRPSEKKIKKKMVLNKSKKKKKLKKEKR